MKDGDILVGKLNTRRHIEELLVELADDHLSIRETADAIEVLFGIRCPKCGSTEIGLRRSFMGYSSECVDCGTELRR